MLGSQAIGLSGKSEHFTPRGFDAYSSWVMSEVHFLGLDTISALISLLRSQRCFQLTPHLLGHLPIPEKLPFDQMI